MDGYEAGIFFAGWYATFLNDTEGIRICVRSKENAHQVRTTFLSMEKWVDLTDEGSAESV